MEIYSFTHRKGSVSRIEAQEIVAAVFLMASKAKQIGCEIIFFPEVGGLPLKYIFQHGVMKQENYNMDAFSSKVTALKKSPLSKQICSLLTLKERNQHLTNDQVSDLVKAITALPQSPKNKLLKLFDTNHLEQYQLSELIGLMGEIGLSIPSEDKSNWIKDSIIPNTYDPNSYSPEDNSTEKFQNFRKKIIAYSIDRMPDIVHDTRPLFNIILSRTHFAKAIHRSMIYVMDEAVSRGRTLNALEVVFKAFNSKATWKIGVLFCPLDARGYGNIDFILSNKRIPPFSNRFDLIGDIVVESDMAFVQYNIDKLFSKAQGAASRHNTKQVTEYLKRIRLYVRRTLSDFLQPGIVDENDLVRLLHLVFVCSDINVIKQCIDLNPKKIDGIIEEVSFYINMPHPFDPMLIRNRYKNNILRALEHIKKIADKSLLSRDLDKLKNDFHTVRKDYEFLELECWSSRYHDMLSQVDSALEQRALQP